jgi:predicted permease
LGSAWITASLIPVLGVKPTLGRTFTEAEDTPNGPHAAIISEALWRNQFGGDPHVIGRTIDVNGLTREIVGVMPQQFRFPTARTELWLPLGIDFSSPYPGGFNYDAVARLKPGVTVEAAQKDFAAVLPRIVEISPNLAPGVSTQMLLDQAKPIPVLIPLRDDLVGDFSRTLWMVGAAAALVLLVACFNVASLILVRADSRQREMAVREALGAGWARLMRHFLAESVVLAALAGAIGLAVASIAIRALVLGGTSAAQRIAIPRLSEVQLDWTAIGFTLVLVALVAAICSVIPALRIGRLTLAHALREGGRSGTAGRVQQRVRGALVAGQIALALVALSASGLLMRTFSRLQGVDLGFHPDHLATMWVSLPGARYKTDSSLVQFYAQLSDRVAALPGAQSVGLTSRLPLLDHGMNWDPFYVEGDVSTKDKIPHLQLFTTVSSSYFRTMGIPLLAGRSFDTPARQRGDEAIISRATASQFFHDPSGQATLGKRFRELPGGPLYTIVGVVGDARDTALAAPPSQTVYFPESVDADTMYGKVARTMAVVVRTSGEPGAMTPAVQRVIRELDPTLPTFDARPMTEVLSNSMARLSFTIVILGAAAIVTLVLGVVGLYGVMAYLVSLRTRELGLRIALGAQPGSVAVMLTRQGLALTGLGVAGGLGLFLAIARFLRSFLYGVAPNDPLTLVGASLILIAVAALASWIPARRASRVDPANTLRAE